MQAVLCVCVCACVCAPWPASGNWTARLRRPLPLWPLRRSEPASAHSPQGQTLAGRQSGLGRQGVGAACAAGRAS